MYKKRLGEVIMKTFFKWLGITLGVVVVLLYLAFIFVLPRAVDLNQFKPKIQQLAQEYSKLDVNFENAQIITTPLLAIGIQAEDLSVKLPDGSLLTSANKIKTRLSLPHLLVLCVKVSCAEIDSPVINLEIQNGKQFKIITLVESILNDGDDTIEQKLLQADAQAESQAAKMPLPIRINIPSIKINNYKAVINDLKTSHSLTLKGETLVLGYNGKSFKVKTNSQLMSDQNTNITANINLNCFIPKAAKLDKEDDPQEIIDIPFVNPVLIYRDYDPKGNINMDMKIRQRKNTILTYGTLNLDNLTMSLSNVTLPPSYIHLNTRGTRANIDTNLVIKEGQAVNILGLINYGRYKLADLKIKSDKIYFNDVIILTKALLDTLRIKNDLNLFAGYGYVVADTQFKTNFKTLKSAGDIKIKDAGIVNKKYNLNFMNFNSLIDLNNNLLQIKDTGATINGTDIKINGSINEKSIADINVYLEKLPLAPLFKSFAPAELKNAYEITSGNIYADVNLTGELKKAISNIKVGLKDFSMYEKASKIKLANNSFEGNFTSDLKNITGNITNKGFKVTIPQSTSIITSDDTVINIDKNDITINPSVLKINNTSTITLNGKIANYNSNPHFDITADGKLVSEGIKQLGGSMAAPFIDAKGIIPFIAKINGDKKKQTLDITIDTDRSNYLTPVHLNLLAGKNTAIKSTIDFKQDRIKIHDSGVYIKTQIPDEKNPDKIITKYNEVIGLSGTVTGLNSTPHINVLKIKTQGDLNGSIQGLDNSSFTFGGHLFSYGALPAPRFKGKFTIKNINIPTLYTTVKTIILDFKGNVLETRVSDLNLNDSVMQINTNISLLPAANIIIDSLNLNSDYIDLDKMMKVSDAAMKLIPQSGVSAVPAGSSTASADISVELRNGKVNIKRAKTGGIDASNITCNLLMKNNILYVSDILANAFEGSLRGNASMNLLSSLLRVNVNGSGFNVEKSLLGLANMKDTLTGTASFDTNVSLQGSTYEEQMKSLNGTVDFTIINGQLGPFGRLENLILAPNIRESEFFQTAIGGIINDLLSVNTSHFDELKGHITLNNGVAEIEPITSLGEIMCLNIEGNFDILANLADLRIRGRLASTVSDMLGPIAMLNPVNMIQTKTGSSIMSLATLGLYTLFCETISQEEMDAIPHFSEEYSDYNATKFQVIARGDVAKPLSLVKSFKWLVLQSDIDNANSYIQQRAIEEAAQNTKNFSNIDEEKAGAIQEIVDTSKNILKGIKGFFKKQ